MTAHNGREYLLYRFQLKYGIRVLLGTCTRLLLLVTSSKIRWNGMHCVRIRVLSVGRVNGIFIPACQGGLLYPTYED